MSSFPSIPLLSPEKRRTADFRVPAAKMETFVAKEEKKGIERDTSNFILANSSLDDHTLHSRGRNLL